MEDNELKTLEETEQGENETDIIEEKENTAPDFSEEDYISDTAADTNPNKKKKRKKRIIILLIIIGVIAALVITNIIAGSVKMKQARDKMYTDTAAERRTISNSITGSSMIEPNDSYKVTTMKSGDIKADYFKEGDTVKKGDKLYQFDDETERKSLKSAQNAVTKAQQNYNDAQKTVNNLSVKASNSGTVKEMFVEVGDSVQQGGKIAAVYDDSTMKIKIPFNDTDAQYIHAGQEAVLTVTGTGNELIGRVTEVSGAAIASSGHSNVRYVTVNVANPGALTNSDRATAVIDGFACNDAGQFEYASSTTISSEASGKIASLKISENSSVRSGQVVALLDSDMANTSLKEAKLNLEDAKLSLEKTQKAVEDYLIEAPIEGTVVTKNAKSGDTVDASNNTEALCVIYDLSCVKLDLKVDETEIALVKAGQKVKVTADAVDGEFEGEVIKVPVDGVNENGVTTYTVEVKIDNYGDLLPGMNVDAEITVSEKQNVIAVPVNSVNRGNIVFVKDDGTKRDNDVTDIINEGKPAPQGNKESKEDGKGKENKDKALPVSTPQNTFKSAAKDGIDASDIPKNIEIPEGYRALVVETGINDTEYIEIISGLSEGDLVRTLNAKSSSEGAFFGSENPMEMEGMYEQRSGGMQSGPGGGMSGGGPGGGMSGGPGGMH